MSEIVFVLFMVMTSTHTGEVVHTGHVATYETMEACVEYQEAYMESFEDMPHDENEFAVSTSCTPAPGPGTYDEDFN